MLSASGKNKSGLGALARRSLVGLLAAIFAAPGAVRAGTVLLGPPVSAYEGDESFPESRFGHSAPWVQPNGRPGLAARENRAMEEDEETGELRKPPTIDASGGAGASRGIASLAVAPFQPLTAPRRAASDDGMGADRSSPSEPAVTTASLASRSEISPRVLAQLKQGVQEVAIIASDLGFFPRTIFVSRDVPVRMYVTGASRGTLCLMMDAFQVRRQVRSQKIEEIGFTPNAPGRYRFYCPVGGLEGLLVVKEFATLPEPRPAATPVASAP